MELSTIIYILCLVIVVLLAALWMHNQGAKDKLRRHIREIERLQTLHAVVLKACTEWEELYNTAGQQRDRYKQDLIKLRTEFQEYKNINPGKTD